MEAHHCYTTFGQSAYNSEHDLVDASIQSQDVFQEQPVDKLHLYHDSIIPSGPQQLGRPDLVDNTAKQQDVKKTYYSDGSFPQDMGIATFCMEKSDKQIRTELERLYGILQRADRYQKYREKQPVLTPAEVMERDGADKRKRERQEAENLPQNQKDSTVWPGFLEYAFWKALVRWPPMGRRKCILGGVLKGRNELIQDSIYRDTGIVRDRKQISSHLQVLKAHLKDFPIALAYMGIMEDSPECHCGSITYQPCCSPHLHSPQITKGTVPTTEGGCIASSHTQSRLDSAYTGSALDAGSYMAQPSHGGLSSHEHFAMPLSPNTLACMQPSMDQFSASASMAEIEPSQGRYPFSPEANESSTAYGSDFYFINGGDRIPDDAPQPTFDVPAYEGFDANGASLRTFSSFDHQG